MRIFVHSPAILIEEMKIVWSFLVSSLLSFPLSGYAFEPDSLAARSFRDLPYAAPDECLFDLYLPASDAPVPLVVIVHGGGFLNGDKREFGGYETIIETMLREKIAVASINYRFRRDDDGRGVARCLEDAADFIRYIRYKAAEFGLDKKRIACIGTSAGAGTALYLAFHPDMADPNAADPLRKESTRLVCAGALSTQATYNLFRWTEFIPAAEAYLRTAEDLLVGFYGFRSPQAFAAVKDSVLPALDMLAMISPDDCPVFVSNELPAGTPRDLDHLLHHPAHAEAVAGQAAEKGVEAVHYTGNQRQEALSRFLLQHLRP